MRRILIDSRAYGMSGIGRYIEFLIRHIRSHTEIEYTVLAYKDHLEELREDLTSRGVHIISSELRAYSLQEVFAGVREFRDLAKRYDLIHFTHTNAPCIIPKNSILTIHDIIPLRLPYRFPAKCYLYLFLAYNIRRCRHITTVSAFTQADVTSLFRSAGQKTTTVYTRFRSMLQQHADYQVPAEIKDFFEAKRCFLYVGNRKTHKNLSFTIKIFDTLMAEYPDLHFVLAGNRFEEDDPVDQALSRATHTDRFLALTAVNDDLLSWLYTHSYALVLFSLYEGFGMPPIEAAAVGTPSLVSDKTSLPEIVDSELCVVPVDSPESTLDHIRKLLDDEDHYKKIQQHLLKRAEFFLNYDSIAELERLYRYYS
ncbi:MAG: glycosyltransferase family 4 protein [Spirochaetia bacterium]|nr:glycosyltransferase family 4 protein [Spirochaetia bacterium]MCF7941090.1 glycosyltransferase family 4 protein [Spirochaetia bacterium]